MRISDWSSDVCSSDLGAWRSIVDWTESRSLTLEAQWPKRGSRRRGRSPVELLDRATEADPDLGSGRSDERCAGKECVRTFSSRRSPYQFKKHNIIRISLTLNSQYIHTCHNVYK